MSQLWFTADAHFGHANISKYCGRPWAARYLDDKGDWLSEAAREECEKRGNEQLIMRWNGRVKPGDTTIHVGDFCCRGAERGVPGLKTKCASWEELLNGKIIHIEGNHDDNNGTKPTLKWAVINIGGHDCFIRHKPMSASQMDHTLWVPPQCRIVICGHVHEKWMFNWNSGILQVNVGVDQHHYAPINKSELIGHIEKEIREHASGNQNK